MFEIKKENVHRTVETIEQAKIYIAEGYELVQNIDNSEEKSEIIDLDSLKYNELKNLAKEKKVKGYTTLTKSDLVKILKELF